MTLPGRDKLILTCWVLVWFTLPLWNLGNSISIALLTPLVLVHTLQHGIRLCFRDLVIPALFFILFGTYIFSEQMFTGTWPDWYLAERKLGLLAIPVIMLLIPLNSAILRKYALQALAVAISFAGVVMLTESGIKFAQSGDWQVFTYHELASPWPAGAVYLSLFTAVLITMMIRTPDDFFPGKANTILMLYFVALLLLCASKLFISLTLPVALYTIFRYQLNLVTARPAVSALVMAAILVLSYPFLQRMSVLLKPELELITQAQYDASTELNGVNLRLIQWRFGLEILRDHNAWISGTGMSERQKLLDARYSEAGLYTGTGIAGDTGFLGYNYHNQWLETTVGSGLPALGVLLLIVVLRFVFHSHNSLFPFIPVLFLLGFFLTESVLERQTGLIFFGLIFCPLRRTS